MSSHIENYSFGCSYFFETTPDKFEKTLCTIIEDILSLGIITSLHL